MGPVNINCRLCECKLDKGIEIFGKQGIKLSIASIVSKHFAVKVAENDEQSNIVCRKCWKTTDQFHKLYCNVEKITSRKNPSIRMMKPDIKTENSLDYLEIEYSVSYSSTDSSTTTLKLENMPGGHYKKRTDQLNKLPLNTETTSLDETSLPQRSNVDRKSNWRSKVIKQDEEISAFLGMNCEMCGSNEKTFIDLMNHFRDVHRVDGYIRCCKRKFTRRKKLYTHIENHKDVNKYKCEQCGKSYLDKDYFIRHVKQHDPNSKPFPCGECSKRYESQRLLHIHTRTHTNEPKPFICDICMKCFNSKHGVVSHILLVHTQHCTIICDVCAKTFKSRVQLEQHYISNHTNIVQPKIQCSICGSWLSNKLSLHKHVRRCHESKEETCTICDKKYPNKEALCKHMQYVHGGRIYECHMCDKTFKSNKALKDHISVHTGYGLYSCTYCSMEFKSSANMYKHRKNVHPVQWQQDRIKNMKLN